MLTCALALSLAPQDNYPRLGISGSVRNVWDPQDLQTAAKLQSVFLLTATVVSSRCGSSPVVGVGDSAGEDKGPE